jgi:glutamyl-tRNA synthetase
VLGEGNKKLSKRDPESNLFLYREQGFLPEGMVNYLALLGWGFSADQDVFTREQMVQRFEAAEVNPNPAHVDLKKAKAINADHMRLLPESEFTERMVPYLQSAGVVSDPITEAQHALLVRATPLVQPRMNLLGEAPDMLRFLFTADADLVIEADATRKMGERAVEVIERAIAEVEGVGADEFVAAKLEEVLRAAIVEDLGIKPRLAFGPLRSSISGRRVSPPLFESMELLGRESSLTRLRAGRDVFAAL